MNKINYEERAKVYTDALETFGATIQLVVALEELSEVQKEICKVLRGEGSTLHLAEEVADATIMLEQIRQMANINDWVCEAMDAKVARLRQRVEEEKVRRRERDQSQRDLLRKAFNLKDENQPEETEENGKTRSGAPTA